jgi:D-alanyl-D-alanine carboxypeptidase
MRDLIADNIARASVKPAIQLAEVPTPKPEPAPVARQQLAGTGVPLQLAPPQTSDATATIATPRPGSSAPIKPVRVKTLAVKLVPPKRLAGGKPAVAGEPAAAPATPAPQAERSSAPAEAPTLAVASNDPAMPVVKVPSPKADDTPARQVTRSGWGIQVGAFEDESEAKERLNSAQSTAPALLQKADAYTERTTKGEKTYFRARFAGFDRDRAQAVCRRLKRNDIACMALKF